MRCRVLHVRWCGRRVAARPLRIAGAGHRAVPRALIELPRAAIRAVGTDGGVVAVALDLERARLEAGEVAGAARRPGRGLGPNRLHRPPPRLRDGLPVELSEICRAVEVL